MVLGHGEGYWFAPSDIGIGEGNLRSATAPLAGEGFISASTDLPFFRPGVSLFLASSVLSQANFQPFPPAACPPTGVPCLSAGVPGGGLAYLPAPVCSICSSVPKSLSMPILALRSRLQGSVLASLFRSLIISRPLLAECRVSSHVCFDISMQQNQFSDSLVAEWEHTITSVLLNSLAFSHSEPPWYMSIWKDAIITAFWKGDLDLIYNAIHSIMTRTNSKHYYKSYINRMLCDCL
jgi:hypothetical protein